MKKIIGKAGTGKTKELLMLAKEYLDTHGDAVIVCEHPRETCEKALAYGITGLEFVPYLDYWAGSYCGHNIFVDDLEKLLFVYDDFIAVTINLEDEVKNVI